MKTKCRVSSDKTEKQTGLSFEHGTEHLPTSDNMYVVKIPLQVKSGYVGLKLYIAYVQMVPVIPTIKKYLT